MRDSLVTVGRSLVFVAVALILCAVVFQFAGYNAPVMLWSVADGAFLRNGAMAQSLRWALPLFITAVGVAISFRAGFFNIGAQGQFYVGAISAAFAAVFSTNTESGSESKPKTSPGFVQNWPTPRFSDWM